MNAAFRTAESANAALGGSAPGAPGIPPTWTSSAKDLVTTALGAGRIWATVGFGILNEVYWPSTGQPEIRDLGFIVAGEDGWHEVKRVGDYSLKTPHPSLPLPQIVHAGPGYRLELEIVPDPARDALLIAYRLDGEGKRLYVLLAPHLGSHGGNNTAWVDDRPDAGPEEGTTDSPGGGLHAVSEGHALFLGCDGGFSRASAGYVGTSDGWQDFARNGRMEWTYRRAENGNVALMGELARPRGVLALAFAETAQGAGVLARSSLAEGVGPVRDGFIRGWQSWTATLRLPTASDDLMDAAWRSAAVLKTHEDRTFPGAVVASLSIPWGQRGDDTGGYHLVWTRDAVEIGLAFLAIGDDASARRMLSYLVATQEAEGYWRQNYAADGTPYWLGIQLDEAALPVLLAARLRTAGQSLPGVDRMVRLAVGYILRNGPLTPQDRWEENAGISPFTLAAEIACLVEAVPFLPAPEAAAALEVADYWNERIEDWTYARNSDLARQHGVDGHYVRIAPDFSGDFRGRIDVRNRSGTSLAAEALIGLDYLHLARLGLRAPDFGPIADTTQIVDRVLRVETPRGVAYRRYNEDGYGEHEDGRAFDGTGIGRAWPLLTGERAHLDLLLGGDPGWALTSMAAMTGPGGLMPEQVWDTTPIPDRDLWPGYPTGSAMPLAWGHAEFLKLLAAQERGKPVEFSDRAWARWRGRPARARAWRWRHAAPFARLPAGRSVWIEADRPFVLHSGFDDWQQVQDRPSAPLPFGLHGVRLTPAALRGRRALDFTFRFPTKDHPQEQQWEGRNYRIFLSA